MITCTILDDISNLQKADYYYTVILYLSAENYDILQKVMASMVDELQNLTANESEDNMGKKQTIQLYFSSNWKFLAIILEFNASNANYFCPWCLCTKKDIGNKHKTWTIKKTMDQLQPAFFNNDTSAKPPPSHIKQPLLQMISLNHYVSDELHIMLRIWDQLWLLVLQELKAEN